MKIFQIFRERTLRRSLGDYVYTKEWKCCGVQILMQRDEIMTTFGGNRRRIIAVHVGILRDWVNCRNLATLT